jgi:hypothetical protein
MWRGDYGYIGPWELSIGRWFWQYLNYLRLDLAPEPAISIISLLSLNVANFLFVEKLDLKVSRLREADVSGSESLWWFARFSRITNLMRQSML